jgi:uncharacterized iron-regulated protein
MLNYSYCTLPLLLALCLTACGTEKTNLIGNPEAPYPPERTAVVGDILHLPTGLYVTETDMLATATDSRIVYVGEVHDNPASHRLELAVLKAMAERYPGEVALGMEMFTPVQQTAIDRWVEGSIDERAFLKEANWYDVWKMDFAYYRPLLEYCREHRIPVIGLNADKSLVHALGRSEPDQLSDELRDKLPQMDMNDHYQQAMVDAVYGGHGPSSTFLNGFKRVQTLWDETMAENIVNYLTSTNSNDKRMVVIAGGNHVRYGFGIPRRVFKRLPSSYALIGSETLVIPEEKKDRIMDITLPPYPMPPLDFITYTEYESLKNEGVKLGVLFDTTEGKLVAQQIMPDSNAVAAGLLANDVLTAIDGKPLTDIYDIKYELSQKKPGDQARLAVERNGEKLELKVTFKEEI